MNLGKDYIQQRSFKGDIEEEEIKGSFIEKSERVEQIRKK